MLLFLFAAFGCNRTSGDENGSGLLGGGKSDEQTKTDSLFVLNYISKEKEFKEHEDLMFKFYAEREYSLAWFKKDKIVPQAEKFLETINKADADGLNPQQYKLVNFDEMFKKYESIGKKDSARFRLQQEIDVALTASYFNFASDFYRGRVSPNEEDRIEWHVRNNKIKLHKALQTILQERESTYPYYEFEALHEGYINLRKALVNYREVEKSGGWQKIELAEKKKLQKGDTAAAVVALRQRLNPGQAVNVNDPNLRLYDDNLEAQVKKFQELHGLAPDGIVGGSTLANMNVPVEERIEQIIINMERWRWIPKRMVPKKLEQKYVWVNIPEYKMHVYEDHGDGFKQVIDMRVIVGKQLNSTPIFSDKLEYVVMAPYWNVPNSIVAAEIKPQILRGDNYLERNNMEIVTKDKANTPVSPGSIDWSSVTEENFKYLVRQRPGPKNSLGSIKFLFPNEYAVYLHDTPSSALFNQNERGFSHGCVRIEKPIDFAKYILKDMPEWNEALIRETINAGEETWVTLPQPVQVYLVYFTSWADKDGNVHFREDIYGHDAKLESEYFS